MIFFQPELQITEQIAASLVLAVVKAAAAPGWMTPRGTIMEVKILPAVKHAQTLRFVVHGVGMHHIHNHGNIHSVSLVHQALELLRSAETG